MDGVNWNEWNGTLDGYWYLIEKRDRERKNKRNDLARLADDGCPNHDEEG